MINSVVFMINSVVFMSDFVGFATNRFVEFL